MILRLHLAVTQLLSGPEKQLIYSYDLSRLDVFEAQAFLQSINKWCAKVERKRRRGQLVSTKVDQVMTSYLRYVLLPLTEKQLDAPFRELEIALGLAPAPMLQLRPTIPSVKPRRKWVSGADVVNASIDGDSILPVVVSPEVMLQDEIMCYRLPVASVGCGIIANMLQHSSSLMKLRLNNCQIADAGAIFLASGIRVCLGDIGTKSFH
ncbi:Multidrug transporter [Phytophthora palmivora]|uniref:Multidrug transporter n=1 Tax=Phytophthora palmivora TaxID=4796 RepID=A0A2P4WYM8_9STRA|nr:Multidrug transporter [Phytophthora palmivora]